VAEHTSARAALSLAKLGVPGVRALKDGWRGWAAAGLPTETGPGTAPAVK
jgi:3-mercaptopyruvate sulfurtransferase SseA